MSADQFSSLQTDRPDVEGSRLWWVDAADNLTIYQIAGGFGVVPDTHDIRDGLTERALGIYPTLDAAKVAYLLFRSMRVTS